MQKGCHFFSGIHAQHPRQHAARVAAFDIAYDPLHPQQVCGVHGKHMIAHGHQQNRACRRAR